MARVCMCKLYPIEENARASGANYYNAFMRPNLKFAYRVGAQGQSWELKVCFEFDEHVAWDLEQDRFRPCTPDDPSPPNPAPTP